MARTKDTTERGPTERQKAAAAAIKSGKSVEDAMAEAGYGPGFIAGAAGDFKTFLEKCGALSSAPAGRGRPVASAADKEG